MVHEEEPISRQPVDALREKVRSVFSPFKGRFSTKRDENRHLLSCLFSSEATVQPVQVPSTTMISQRKDYSYLKPRVLNFDCTRGELSKFFLGTSGSVLQAKALELDLISNVVALYDRGGG